MQLSNPRVYEKVQEMSNFKTLEELQTEMEMYIIIDDSINQGIDLSQIEEGYDSNIIENYLKLKNEYGDSYFNVAFNSIKQISMSERLGLYHDYNKKVLDETQELLKRNKENQSTYTYKFLKSTERVYKNLQHIKIQEPSNHSVDAYVSSNYRELVSLFFVIFFVYNLLTNDLTNDMNDVLRITSAGKKQLFFNKLFTLGLGVTIFVLMNEVLIVCYSILKYGNFDWFINIQNFSSLISSPWNLTVYQLIIFSIVLKVLNGVVIAFVLFSLVSAFDNKNTGVFLSVVLLGVSIFLFYSIQDNSVYRNFKYINLYGIGMIFVMVKNFIYLNLGVISGPWIVVSSLFSIILLFVFFLISRQSYIYYENGISFNFERKSKKRKMYDTTSLFKHELIKSFIMEGNLIIISLGIILSSILFFNITKAETSKYNASIIEYIDLYGGAIDDELILHFETEENRYREIKQEHKDLIFKYNIGEISDEQYQSHLTNYLPINQEMTVFNSVLIRLSNSHDYLINTSGYEIITAQYSYKTDHTIAILLTILLIIVISNFYSIDQKESESTIYDFTAQGSKNRSIMKLIMTILLTTISVILIYGIYYIVILNKYGLNFNDISMINIINPEVNSVGFNKNSDLLELSVDKYLILLHFTRFIGYLFIALVSLLVSKLVKNRSMVILILCFIFVIPSILFLLGFNSFYFITIFDLISGNMYYRQNGEFVKLIVIICLSLIIFSYFILSLRRSK